MIDDDYDVQIPIKGHKEEEQQGILLLDGILTLPQGNAKRRRTGIVVFAHGSGSSGMHSPRNRYVASVLNNSSGIGTLLVDLLTAEEQEIDEKTREYRFNIKLLANRLAAITDWLLLENRKTPNVTIGYFGASTGAAAALIAAAERTSDEDNMSIVKAIVSRGGRPDLANSSYLKKVRAPTLFLVGSKDNPQVIALNQKHCSSSKMPRRKDW